jgi:hypothetical protein|tara:strand:- start:1355 stop:1639 length:285 start_codon:yes stop_codon:yes gene_type:complete
MTKRKLESKERELTEKALEKTIKQNNVLVKSVEILKFKIEKEYPHQFLLNDQDAREKVDMGEKTIKENENTIKNLLEQLDNGVTSKKTGDVKNG